MTYHRKILRLALPVMAESLLQSLVGMVDTYLIAQLGLAVVSGVTLAGNILAVYQAIFIALAAVVSARLASQVMQKDADLIRSAALSLTIWISLALGLLASLGGPWLVRLLGADQTLAQSATLYLAWVGGTCFLLGLSLILGALLRVEGQVNRPMQVSFWVNLLNILLSALAVYALGWGVLGVALGTLLSRLIGLILLYRSLRHKPQKISWTLDRNLLSQVFPATGERLMMRLGDLVVTRLIVGLGGLVLGGYAIGETLTQFNYLPGMGVAVATLILTAQLKGQPQEEAKLLRESYWMSFGLMALISGFLVLGGPWLIGLYSSDPGASLAAGQVIWLSFLGTPVTAGTLMMTAYWQGKGKANWPFYATALGMWIVRIGIGYAFITVFRLGLMSLLVSTLLDNLWRWLFLTYLYIKYKEKSFD